MMFTHQGDRRADHTTAWLLIASVATLSTAPSPAAAITVNVNYNPLTSEGPGVDPFGIALMTVVQAAADQWEDMILDPWTVTIDISWQDPADMFSGTALAEGISTSSVAGKPVTGYVRFNNTKDFYFDATPYEDEEYNMQQTLYRDIDPLLQAPWYGGDVPQVLEAGYRGDAFGGQAPDIYNTDLFSVAMHEIGHVLGMNAEVNGGQVGDGDYDVNPAFVGGAVMDISDNDEHLSVIDAAMYPSIGTGERKRITATDLFAIASAVNWASVDARRKDYLGGLDFADPANWLSGRVPGVFDDAYVRKNDTLPYFTTASGSVSAGNLNILEGSWVTTDHVLNVFGKATIDGSGYLSDDARLRIQSNGALFTDTLLIDSNATLELLDGTTDVSEDAFIAIGGTLKGAGALFVTDRLTNNGLIAAQGVQTLILTTFSPDPVDVWDLGGAGGGVVEAINGNIFVHGSHFGEFAGTMTIGPRREVDMDKAWTLAPTGFLNLNGGTDVFATFSGDIATLKGAVNVDVNGKMDGIIRFESPASVTINDANDRLVLEGNTTFAGGSYTGNGEIVQATNFFIDADTTISNATFNWGNSGPFNSNDLTVEPSATLTINSTTTGTPDNEYRGVIRLSSGAMEVNTSSPWTLPEQGAPGGIPPVPKGTLILDSSKTGIEPTLRGQKLILAGLLGATGGFNYVEAALDTMPSAEISIFTNSHLILKGATNYNGGNIHGGGKLWQHGDALVTGNTTINTAFMDWDGDEADPSDTTIQPGALFTIQSEHIEANPLFEGHSGHITVSDNAALVVITDITWLTDGQMTLLGQPVATPQAIVDGSPLGNYGRVEGNGWFQSTFANVGTLSPGLSAGGMRFSNTLILYNESIVEIEVGGDIPILTYDRLQTDGTVFINGLLDVSLINGFVPPVGSGDQYDFLISATPINGTFDAVTLPPSLGLLYTSNMVSLIAGLPGDLNGDGFVGIDDLNIVLTNWNNNADPGVWSGGDPSGDGFIGIDDLNTVLSNWNNGTPPPASASIPEPATVWLLVSGLSLVSKRHTTRLVYCKKNVSEILTQ